MHQIVYKIMTAAQWADFETTQVFTGAPIDVTDGYIHLSTESQVEETAAKHFSGQSDLMLVAVATQKLGEAMKYEMSRGNDLFPHLYRHMTTNDMIWARQLPLEASGRHRFPGLD